MADGVKTALLRDRYEPLETVGASAEVRVVRALDHQHDRLVALKMRRVGSEAARAEVLSEARVLLDLAPHPSLPLVREDFFEDDQYVVVMDWVEGTDLAKLVRDSGSPGLPLSSVLVYLAVAAEALSFLHAHDPPVIHGDVKPANLILTRGGHVKLVFGLFSTLGMRTQQTAAVGFQAPELRAGSPPSRASDVYSLSATAFALLTGSPPVDGLTRWDELGDGQAARLRVAIEAGLATDPTHRPATPGELLERLRSGWASTLPTGTMTFCLSDIEGSTSLWDRKPEAMAEALVLHDELIATVVEAHGGRFLKSMGEGDSTASVFESAAQAVRAAIDLSRTLAVEPWPSGLEIRVRLGLHTGEAQRRGDVYFGTTLNLAARVREQARGGEILLSEKTAALASDGLPAGYTIVDLGPHRLRGVEAPVNLSAISGPGLREAPPATECPYRGLRSFEPRDRPLFFGREEVVADVLARVARGRLLAVIGPSGRGKSSLLKAGVIAVTEAGQLFSAHRARLITPGPTPPLELDEDEDELLVADQFEELYTQCQDIARRTSFIDALLSRRGPTVIGVRADFYGELSAHPALADAVARNQILLGPMSDDELRRAICEPARLAGLRLEPGLVDLVLRDVAGEPGALPLMSHALRETWERRDGRTLTVDAYRETGGVGSALARTADALAADTPPEDRPLLRGVFLRLIEVGDDAEETRRRARMDELVPQGASPDTVRGLLERLSESRLVTLDEGGTVELAHEVLIQRWPTLRRWLEEDREGFRLHHRLGDAARLWHAAGREPADLYRGTRLDAAVEWAKGRGELLNQTERDFLDASLEESAATQRRQLRINRRLRRALATGAGLLVAALALLVFALVSRHTAVNAEATARSRVLAGEAEGQVGRDPQRALLLARAALKVAPTPEAELAASEALDANTVRAQLPSFGVQRCADSDWTYLLAGGRIAVNNGCDGRLVFGDLVTKRIIRSVRVGDSTTAMHFDPSGRILIVAAGRNLVAVDPNSYRFRTVFTAPFRMTQTATEFPGKVYAIADADTVGVIERGSLRVVARGDASVNPVLTMRWVSSRDLLIETGGQSRGAGDLAPGLTVLDVVTGTRRAVPLPMPAGHYAVLSFMNISADRRTWFLTGADVQHISAAQVASTWAIDARTWRVRWVARGPAGQQASIVQGSRDNRFVAVGYSQDAIDVLDASTGALVVRDLGSADIWAGWLAFTPRSGSLVTATGDGVFRIWSVHGSERLRLQAPPAPAVAFTPDGRDLLLVGARGQLVDAHTGATVGHSFRGFPVTSTVNGCYFACFAASPGLRWLTYLDATSARPRIVEINGQTGRRIASLYVARLDAQGVAPDGRIVAAYVEGGRINAELIDPSTRAVRPLQAAQSSSGCAAAAPSFTPDGRFMAIDDGCVSLVVWDLRSGRVVRTAVLPERANASNGATGGAVIGSGAVLSPDGRYALVGVQGGGLVRLDVATGSITEVPGTATVTTALAISPDGRFYAIGRQDGTVDEYDARTLQLVRDHTLNKPIRRIAFSPDSRELAVEDANYVLRVWDTCDFCENAKALARLAARETVRPLTPSERATFGVGWP